MDTINALKPVNEIAKLITDGHLLVIAGAEEVLDQLPKGNWVGGTIPYFMDSKGGCFSSDEAFIVDFTDASKDFKLRAYNENNLESFMQDRFTTGFTYVLLPGFSPILQQYAIDMPGFSEIYDIPVMGWVTGFDLSSQSGKALVFNGQTQEKSDNMAIMLHVNLPAGKVAQLEILNLFKPGMGDEIEFIDNGFKVKECLINGKEKNFSEYLIEHKIDTKLPLVADYSGAMVNTSFREVNQQDSTVLLYAPVQKGVKYKIADNVGDYVAGFNKIVPSETSDVVASCNCILNYLYSDLNGKKTGTFTGPFTFGEVAYVLVNQTLVYLKLV